MDETTCLRLLLLASGLLHVHLTAGVVDDRQRSQGRQGDATTVGPKLLSEPPNTLIFTSEHGGRVDCVVYGRPTPTVSWAFDNGSAITNSSARANNLIEVLANNSLRFKPFPDALYDSRIHNGRFRCKASSSAGTVISRRVQVRAVLFNQLKTFNVRASDVYITAGDTAVLRCIVEPYYIREFVRISHWTQDGKSILLNKDLRLHHSALTGNLYIRDVRAIDGFSSYRCVAVNTLTGAVRTSDPAMLHIIETNALPPVIGDFSYDVTIGEQWSDIQLPCVAAGQPVPAYRWYKDGTLLTADAHERIHVTNIGISISSALRGDSGTYTCVASNAYGDDRKTTELTVYERFSVAVEPAIAIGDAGKEVTFNCTVYGGPVLAIVWYKDGRPIEYSDRITLLHTNTTLLLKQLEKRDKGIYQCIVWNNIDNSQATAQLLLGAAKPEIIAGFADSLVQGGSSVSLKCVVSGNPLPTVSWFRYDVPVTIYDNAHYTLDYVVIGDSEATSFLNISAVGSEHGGTYKCEASNALSTASYTGQLTVYGPPYIDPFVNLSSVAEDTVTFICRVGGYPITSINWFKGGVRLPFNHRHQLTAGGTLTISSVSRSDAGEYVCSARNDDYEGMRRSVYLTVLEPPRIDPFYFSRKMLGDRVSVTCVISSGDLPITITWLKDGQSLPSRLGINIQQTDVYSSTLTITDSNQDHSGNYSCLATNVATTVQYSAVLQVNVPPTWTIEPFHAVVLQGSRLVVDCAAHGSPKPRINWQKSADAISWKYTDISTLPSDRVYQLSNGSLVIEEAIEAHSGYYLCHSSNNVGAGLSKVITITVHVPARISRLAANITSVKGSNASFECKANGDRPISVGWSVGQKTGDWTKERRFLSELTSTSTHMISRFSITDTQRQDAGIYVCTAQNAYGTDAVVFQLTVLEVPESPVQIHVMSGRSRDFDVSWQPGFNGNSDITSFLLQWKNASDSWSNAKSVKISSRMFSINIGNLHPASSYSLRVFASNIVGLSNPSAEIVFTTEEEAPSASPILLTISPVGSQSLNVTWKPPPAGQQNGELIGYNVGYKLYNSTLPYAYLTRTVSELSEPMSVIISGLDKFSKYAIHVQAFNRVGTGPKSADSISLTMEDVPSEPPADVQAVALGSQSVLVLWSPPPLAALHGILQGYKLVYKRQSYDEDENEAVAAMTTSLSLTISGLEKYTNYSVQVLAYTRMGDGVLSQPIHITTDQDVPDTPADVKVIVMNATAVTIAWRPPQHANGIVVHYVVVWKDATLPADNYQQLNVAGTEQSQMIGGLVANHEYSFHVTACTVIGCSKPTNDVAAIPLDNVAPKIVGFSDDFMLSWLQNVVLPCQAVGSANVVWKKGDDIVRVDDRVQVAGNNSLLIFSLAPVDSGIYTCRVENEFGFDEIHIRLNVQAPPKPPQLRLSASTHSSIQVNWLASSNGGSSILGFRVYYKSDLGEWHVTTVGATNRSFIKTELQCGTKYSFYVTAFNRIGNSAASNTVVARTNGTVPPPPSQSQLLKQINSTYIILSLQSWPDGGCALSMFDIEYQVWGDDRWLTAATQLPATKEDYHMDLYPETWYIVRVRAYNDAGSSVAVLKFITTNYEGVHPPIEPIRLFHRRKAPIYQRVEIVVPMCAAVIFLLITLIGLSLYCQRRAVAAKIHGSNSRIERSNQENERQSFILAQQNNLNNHEIYMSDILTNDPAITGSRLSADDTDDRAYPRDHLHSWLLSNSALSATPGGDAMSESETHLLMHITPVPVPMSCLHLPGIEEVDAETELLAGMLTPMSTSSTKPSSEIRF